MDNGTYLYALEMETPLGRRRGELELVVWDNFLSGYLTMFTRTIPIHNGRRSGANIFFEGDMKTFLKTTPYRAAGVVTEKKIKLAIEFERGRYQAVGFLTDTGRNG